MIAMTISTDRKQCKPIERCATCANWSKGMGVAWLHGVPDWCGEYAEPVRGDEPACAAYRACDAAIAKAGSPS